MNSKQRRKFTRTYKEAIAGERVAARLTGQCSWLPFSKVRVHDSFLHFFTYTAAHLEYQNALYCRRTKTQEDCRFLPDDYGG